MRKSTFLSPDPVRELRGTPGKRAAEVPLGGVPELFTAPPVKPPSIPPAGLPFTMGVIGEPAATVTMVEKTKPSRMFFATLLERFLAYGGIQTRLPTKRCRWSRSESAYCNFLLYGSSGVSVPLK